MRTPHQRQTASVIDSLLAAPQEFEFVQAVRLLLGWLEQQGVAPAEALRGHLRFDNSLRLGFPTAQIESLRCEIAAPAAADERPAPPRMRLTPSFMGLLGVQGTLPAHVTERIAAWQAEHRDEAPRAFLDMLSGRMLALYYEAWFKYRVEHAQGAAGDRLRPLLLALAGGAPASGAAASSAAAEVPADLIAHFAGLLQQRPVSGVVLERLLASYFGVAVNLDEAVGHWSRLLPGEQSAVGTNARLGENTLLGARSWRPDLRARLRIGPLARAAFDRFLPSGDAAAMLGSILRMLAPPTVEFEVQLVLRGADVGPSCLASSPAAARLGRDSFLVDGTVCADRADMRYLIAPMAPLAPLKARRKR